METAENLCLGFGCRGKRNFAKVSGRLKVFQTALSFKSEGLKPSSPASI